MEVLGLPHALHLCTPLPQHIPKNKHREDDFRVLCKCNLGVLMPLNAYKCTHVCTRNVCIHGITETHTVMAPSPVESTGILQLMWHPAH